MQAKKSRRDSSDSPRSGRVWTWNHRHLSLSFIIIAVLVCLFLGGLGYLHLILKIPGMAGLVNYDPPQTTVFLDNRGVRIAAFYRENRTVISLADMAELLPRAFIAAEDGRFMEHSGVDLWSVIRAFVHNMRAGGRSHGGSTITQQVARAFFLSTEKTYKRKIREAILAYRIDRILSKREILYLYLNQIYLGEGAYGVEAAAETYFGKRAQVLDLAEISILAGLPQAPSRYSPFKNFELAKARQRYVLNRMAADGYITPEAARAAYEKTINWKQQKDPGGQRRFFIDQVRRYVEKRYGRSRLLTGGLTVHTTMDSRYQDYAARSLKGGIEAWRERNPRVRREPQAALVAIENKTGRVRALIGGTDYSASQFNRAVQSRRQPGSAFKPIIYAAAMARDHTPADIIEDEPLRLPGSSGGLSWEPRNFDGDFLGPTTLRTALVKSRNIVTIKLLQEVGVGVVRRLAGRMGISARLSRDLSLALGTSGVSLLEMTGAYTVFANRGIYRAPLMVERILDRRGRILEVGRQEVRRVMRPRTAYLMTDMLKGVIEEGTGRRARGLGVDAAGKTGTSDANTDAWFIGYTPELAAGVWLGFDQTRSLGERETGGVAAAPVWRDFMAEVLAYEEVETREFAVPDGIIRLPMNPETGAILTEKAEHAVWAAFQMDKLPPGFRKPVSE